MRIRTAILLIALGTATEVAFARSSGRPSSSAPRRSSGGSRSSGSSGRNGSGKSRRRDPIDDSDDEDPLGFDVGDDVDDGADDYDDYDEEVTAPRRGASGSRRGAAPRGPPPRQGRRQPPARVVDDYEEDDYDDEDDYPPPSRRGSGGGSSRGRGPPPSRGGRGPPPGRRGGPNDGRMVSYNQSRRRGGPPPPSTFTRGLSAIRDKMPDPTAVKDTMLSATKAAQERTSQFSSNIYRDVKGLTSSELEQVMLKSTRPDDTPVKTKHVERLVGVTYQISGKYDIYDAVLRKLWNKMAEKDMRTKLKSVYVLHRFAVDGSPGHQEALKQRLRALRKTKDPKRSSGGRGGTRYFDSKVLIGADDDPETSGYRAFLSRYAHYVLTRAQTFGGIFNEISLASIPTPPTSKKGRSKSKGDGSVKPKNPPLCEEHLKFAQMVLKAGLACTLHDREDSESTAMCVERVAADLMGLTAVVAVALKRELKQQTISEDSEELVKQWCEFYSEELLPETKKFCKKVTNKLDAYGLYLPSRMSASLPTDLLEKGLKLGAGAGEKEDEEGEEVEEDASDEEKSEKSEEGEVDGGTADEGDVSMAMSADAASPQDDEYDEYEYDEYDEYD
mmetsp:Transcript_14037/g.30554  ORF Transcript_14037/g.30554 Transcript_14037/m.30554 type:complete len:615 (-) Transcript_14037:163-2007(-)|eukprot:CAMPEP_0172301212 /NCGR_PEP_ID=MMETSP1058-20130122/3135_1 /TAXON_ID=83371 /ORGANISM="Detonula confervacea, Strain CCMP 353" /LENGTH=614 /DNA_ID=CAMNT_0013011245 /DNA_START=15 /DNA_END=1859 /DNA_ORIENTATION=-